jgi:GT2 family glycosyltransferase
MTDTSVWVILLNYNSAKDTLACVDSLSLLDMQFRLLVVDNASADDSIDQLSQRVSKDQLVRNNENKGFAAGNNLGIQKALEAGARFVWLLNNDTLVEPNSLSAMLRMMDEDPGLGAVGSVIHEMSNKNEIQSWGGGVLHFSTGHCRNLLRASQNLTYLTAASVLVRAEALREVMLDEAFFFLWEDVDFSLRLKRAHWGIGVSPESIVYHKGGGSEPRLSAQRLEWHAFGLVRVLRTHGLFPWLTTLPIWGYYVYQAVSRMSPSILLHAARGWIKGWTKPLCQLSEARDLH